MKQLLKTTILFLLIGFLACSTDEPTYGNGQNGQSNSETTYNILNLGDSYTYGQSVCGSCRFPVQLKDALEDALNDTNITVEIIAQTGWTTTDLLQGIAATSLPSDNDLVTLLIGVNNQYQGKPFSLYESEFPQLVNDAIDLANGNKEKVIVVSIPDYAYTPFGQGNTDISEGIDQYNSFAQNYCNSNDIVFVNITDITRLGLEQPELVASDGLHPSALAYEKFVERIFPFALTRIE